MGVLQHTAVLNFSTRIDDNVARGGSNGVVPNLHGVGEVHLRKIVLVQHSPHTGLI